MRGSRYWKRLQREGWKELEEEAEGWSWCGTEKNKAGGESVWSLRISQRVSRTMVLTEVKGVH